MDDTVDAEDIVSVCAGLVTIDQESDVIRLVHYTAQEYFQHVRPIWAGVVQEDYFASVCLTYLCLTYLCFDCFVGQTGTSDEFPMELYPFLGYAARYWGVHARSTQEPISGLALRLLLDPPLVSFSVQAAFRDSGAGWMARSRRGLDPLATNLNIHVMAAFGLDFIMDQVTTRQGTATLDVADRNGRTPLSFAAEHGHDAVISLLLGHNVDIDAPDRSGRGPLSYAASGGHLTVVGLLLRHDAYADARDAGGRTPLWWAAQEDSTAAAKELLNHGRIDTNAADTWAGQTPLHLAARGGYKEMVELLLGQTALDPGVSDMEGRTALWYAAEQDHHEIARILLEIEAVGENAKDIYGQTPLAAAASRGNTTTVTLLLQNTRVDVESRDMYGRTPLAMAAEYGHATVVEQLLATRCDIDADCRDQDNWTPLLSAAYGGHKPVLEALLRHGAADVNAASQGGLTPLSCAQHSSRKDCVAILLGHQNIQADNPRNSITESRKDERAVFRHTSTQIQHNTKASATSCSISPACDLENLISRLLQAGKHRVKPRFLPSAEEIRYLCIEARKVLLSQPSPLELTAPIKV
jgi:ankyrin repeat protein